MISKSAVDPAEAPTSAVGVPSREELEDRVQLLEGQLKRANEQIQRSQKLETLGRLVGGVTHDFNNFLSAILSYSELLLVDTPPNAHGWRELSEIKQAGERAADLTRQILAFSRQRVVETKVLDLNEVLGGLENLLGRLVGEGVDLRCLRERGALTIRANHSQIEQVIVNLVVNSRDAMPRGGAVTVATASVIVPRARCASLGVEAGEYVVLSVTDTGVGMDSLTLRRIFDPFFTTKATGKGTGFGLSTVSSVVKSCGGAITVQSAPDRGASFVLYFPRHGGVVEPRKESVFEPRTGGGTVLVVDDETLVRNVATRILERTGYVVLSANSFEEARLLALQANQIDLLLTDVVMPGAGGSELAVEIRRRFPGVSVLFMSGYTEDEVRRNGIEPGRAFVQKPLTPERLVRKVEEALRRPDETGEG